MKHKRCEENTETKKGRGGERLCKPCDSCYSLVKAEVDTHREQLFQLGQLLQTIAENPEPVQEDFEGELDKVEVRVSALLEQVETSIGGGPAMEEQMKELASSLADARKLSREADGVLDEAEVGKRHHCHYFHNILLGWRGGFSQYFHHNIW